MPGLNDGKGKVTMPAFPNTNSEAVLLARALRNGAADKTSGRRLREIIQILWNHQMQRGITPEKVVAVLEDLGPTFVKLGQIVSARKDMFPKEYCEALSTLRTQSTPMPFEQVQQRLSEAYDGNYTQVFSSIDERPLGSASVAQVHRGSLREDGTVVAIKVQRPGVKKLMVEDIQLIRRASDLLELQAARSEAIANFDVSTFIDELERTVRDEIDFRREAENLRDFHANCENVPNVTSPKVYERLTSETVLVMDYVEGPCLNDAEACQQVGVDPVEVGRIITRHYIRQLLADGLFHADPHAGNIIVQPGPQVQWIDLGMVGRLSGTERALLRRMFLGVAARDAREMKNVLLTWGRTTGDLDHGRVLAEIDLMLNRYAADSIADIDVAEAVNDLLALVRGQNIAMPASFTMLARGIVSFEGTIETIAPDISIIGAIDDYLRGDLLSDFNLFDEVRDGLFTARRLSKDLLELPSQTSELMDMLSKGELSVKMSTGDMTEPAEKMSAAADRLTLGMIIAGLFIGSSLLCTTGMEPRVLGVPVIGFLGYTGALALSIYVLIKGKPSG